MEASCCRRAAAQALDPTRPAISRNSALRRGSLASWGATPFWGGHGRDRVSGRTRFEIGLLCGSLRGKRRLERGLGARAAVQRIDADLRTGYLLLVYDPSVALDEVLRRIAAVLGVAV